MVDEAADVVTPRAPQPPGTDRPALDRRVTYRQVILLGTVIAVAFVGLAALYLIVSSRQDQLASGLGTIVLLLAGLAVVTLLLYLGSLILRALDLANPNEAMGMPPGSIRAMIAVSLILLFAIVGFVVFRAASDRPSATSRSLSQAQIDKLRLDGSAIVSQSLVSAGASPGLELYDVETVPPLSADAHDFGLQLLSTTITLVVAVAGFYFGAQTVNQAGKETRTQLGLIQDARTARRAEIIGAVPDPPVPIPDDTGDEPPISDADDLEAPSTTGDAAGVGESSPGDQKPNEPPTD